MIRRSKNPKFDFKMYRSMCHSSKIHLSNGFMSFNILTSRRDVATLSTILKFRMQSASSSAGPVTRRK